MYEENSLDGLREQLIYDMRRLGEISEQELRKRIDERITESGGRFRLGIRDRSRLATEVFNAIRRLGILQELVDDSTISEIMINGPDDIFIEKNGEITRWAKKFQSREELENMIQQIVGRNNRIVNETNPIVDTRLSNGSRVNVVLPPVALDGPIVTIRRFPENPYSMQDLIHLDSLSKEIAWFLRVLVKSGYNIFVCGGTGSGKTTFLNALAGFIPKEERVITIEDSAELNIPGIANLVRMETRNANLEGENEIPIRSLIRTSLRMRPDRIIVGEVRGGEALDMLTAMNTGHDGSFSTGHGNSAKDMIKRLETMVLMGGTELPVTAVRGQIAAGIDILIHLGRLRDRTRKLLTIDEIEGVEDNEIRLHSLYRFEEQGEQDGRIYGEWRKTGELKRQEKLRNSGMAQMLKVENSGKLAKR